jgi:hypothetical protein
MASVYNYNEYKACNQKAPIERTLKLTPTKVSESATFVVCGNN